MGGQPFSLLAQLFNDPTMNQILSSERTVELWLEVEAALAWAQADVGEHSVAVAEQISAACTLNSVDFEGLWRQARVVGYPILPLIRMVGQKLKPEAAARLHFGATTQDIMDTGLSLQLAEATQHLADLLQQVGDATASLVEQHRLSVMAARTHAQQAVPTTFGTKMAVYLWEWERHRSGLIALHKELLVVSLYGAGGTSAALGPQAAQIRERMALRLGLKAPMVPWHVARGRLYELAAWCGRCCASISRLAQEVIDLSRTEIGEVKEPAGHHRGASSTMPQKANPIDCEALIGLGSVVGGLLAAMHYSSQHGHERAAGQWQAEWQLLPQMLGHTATALLVAAELLANLRVFPEVMRTNLLQDGGRVMAEAYMIGLAHSLGQAQAHDLVYQAASSSRASGQSLEEALEQIWPQQQGSFVRIQPEDYLGQAVQTCQAALDCWRKA